MKKFYYSFLTLIMLLSAIAVYGQKHILFIGRGTATNITAYQSDADLLDSLNSWGFKTSYMPNDVYSAGIEVTVFDTIDGCFMNESVDSKAMRDFGTTHDYPVPLVCLEGYVVSNTNDRWAWIADGAELYQTPDGEGSEDDRVIIIKDNSHYITEIFENDDEIQWSTIEEASGMADNRPVSITESEVDFSSTLAILKSHEDQTDFWNLLTVDEIGSNGNKIVYWGMNHIGLNGADQTMHLGTEDFFTIVKRAAEWAYDAMPEPEAVKNVDQDKYKLALYPNPATNRVIVQFNANYGQNAIVSLLNITGSQVNNSFLKATVEGKNHLEIELTDYPKGVYFVKLQVENDVIYNKLIVD